MIYRRTLEGVKLKPVVQTHTHTHREELIPSVDSLGIRGMCCSREINGSPKIQADLRSKLFKNTTLTSDLEVCGEWFSSKPKRNYLCKL